MVIRGRARWALGVPQGPLALRAERGPLGPANPRANVYYWPICKELGSSGPQFRVYLSVIYDSRVPLGPQNPLVSNRKARRFVPRIPQNSSLCDEFWGILELHFWRNPRL